MTEGIRVYSRLASASVRSFMQYKFSFVVNSLVYMLLLLSDSASVCVVLYHFKSMGGWSFAEVAALYGLVSAARSIVRTLCSEIQNFDDYIVRGEFDGLLLRPWPTLLLLMGRQLQPFRLSGVLQGAIVLGLGLHYRGNIGVLGLWLVPYLILLLVASTLILSGMEVIISATAFWTTRTGDLKVFLIYGPTTAGMYPLSVFPRIMRTFFTIWPVAFVGYVPIRYIFGHGGSQWSLVAPFIAAVVSVTVALLVWHAGERAYHSTGS